MMVPHQRQLMLSELLLNPSVPAVDEKRLSRQAMELYKLLRRGPARTIDLILPDGLSCPYCGRWFSAYRGLKIVCMYQSRLNELRHALVHRGVMIDEDKAEGGGHVYRIVPLEESMFWRKVKKKGQQWKWL